MGIDGAQQMKRAVFLDRDGVINEAVVKGGKPYPPSDAASLRIPKGTAEALARLKERGFLLLVVTNQPDVARGKQSARGCRGDKSAFKLCPRNRRCTDLLP